ncbi:hypothetical protein, partial [Gilvimarinus agarilyticus]|uniref:hypothetical protein n=1 Tax=Gilvimarinus agarilyticus TaxID=679259 RepID=UPI001E3E95F7
TGIKTVRQFKVEAIKALGMVKEVYPQANFNTDTEQCLILISSPPHIAPQAAPSQKELDLNS